MSKLTLLRPTKLIMDVPSVSESRSSKRIGVRTIQSLCLICMWCLAIATPLLSNPKDHSIPSSSNSGNTSSDNTRTAQWLEPQQSMQLGVPTEVRLFLPCSIVSKDLPNLPQLKQTRWRWGPITQAYEETKTTTRYQRQNISPNQAVIGSILTLEVIALQSGTLTLPSMSFNTSDPSISDLSINSPVLSLNVPPAEVSKAMSLEVSLPTGDLYVGEGFQVDVKWTTSLALNNIQAVHFNLPFARHPNFILHPSPKPQVDAKHHIGLPIGSQRIIGAWKKSKLGENMAHTISFSLILSAKEAQSYDFGSFDIYCSVARQQRSSQVKNWKGMPYPSYFNNTFFEGTEEQTNYKRVTANCPATKLNIVPLPKEGRPAQFSGHIGIPQLKLHTLESHWLEGQSHELQLDVISNTLIAPPKPILSEQPSYSENFSWSQQGLKTLQVGQHQLYRFELTPRHSECEQIPPIVMHVFDPDEAVYKTIRSNSPEIHIETDPHHDQTQQKLASWFDAREKPKRDPNGWWGDNWEQKPKHLLNASQLVWFAIIALPLCVIIAWTVIRAFKAWKEARRPSKELQLLLQQLKTWGEASDDDAARQLHHHLLNFMRSQNLSLHDQPSHRHELRVLYSFKQQLSQRIYPKSTTTSPSEKQVSHRELYDCLMQCEQKQRKCHPKSGHAKLIALMLGCSLASLSFLSMELSAETEPADQENSIRDWKALSQLAYRSSLHDPQQSSAIHEHLALELEQAFSNQNSTEPWQRAQMAFNIGNHWGQHQQYGKAILWYLRAERHDPNFPKLQDNLRTARQQRMDDLPQHFIPQPWLQHLEEHRSILLMLFVIFHYILCYQWLKAMKNKQRIKRFHMPSLVAWFALGAILCIQNVVTLKNTPQAVITKASSIARKGPSAIFSPAFDAPLHSGTELIFIDQQERWSKVRLSNGEICWLANSAFENIEKSVGEKKVKQISPKL